VLQQAETDMTLFFRVSPCLGQQIEPLRAAFYQDGEPSEAHRARLVGVARAI